MVRSKGEVITNNKDLNLPINIAYSIMGSTRPKREDDEIQTIRREPNFHTSLSYLMTKAQRHDLSSELPD